MVPETSRDGMSFEAVCSRLSLDSSYVDSGAAVRLGCLLHDGLFSDGPRIRTGCVCFRGVCAGGRCLTSRRWIRDACVVRHRVAGGATGRAPSRWALPCLELRVGARNA